MKNNKGFTLAELLIVVAIISVLVGISIPVFNTQLEKARESRDLANVRNVYAEVMNSVLSNETDIENSNGVIYNFKRWYKTVNISQHIPDWQTTGSLNIGGVSSSDAIHWKGHPTPYGQCIVSYSESDGVIITWGYDFTNIINNTPIENSGSYQGKTVRELFNSGEFSMFESSGTTGSGITKKIKDLIGMKDATDFSYKILPIKGQKDQYEIYISTQRALGTGKPSNTAAYGNIEVTGYIYEIKEDDSSRLIKAGSTQSVNTYVNRYGQEKIDVKGNQDNASSIPNKVINSGYIWDI